MRLPTLALRSAALTVRADAELPPGVIGRVEGIAVRYGVVDSWGTRFKRGSLDKTRKKVEKGEVKLFDNHGASDMYGTRSHVGVVRSLVTDGDGERMVADLFDTEDGRRAKEYLSAVMASGGQTGLSIGFYERGGAWSKVDDRDVYDFDEIELDEISLAPRQAVPGANVLGVRAESAMSAGSARAVLRAVRASVGAETFAALLRTDLEEEPTGADDAPVETPATADETTGADDAPAVVSMQERAARVRALLQMYSTID
jgi:HK97 family phage prohead protease